MIIDVILVTLLFLFYTYAMYIYFNISSASRRGRDHNYGSWIYNYLSSKFLSPATLWVRITLMARCTRYNIVW